MTSTLTTIARTISDELERAVAAAEEAQNAGLDLANNEIKTTLQRHSEAIDSAVELEREAASMIAAAVKVRENAQKALYESMGAIHQRIMSLRSEGVKRVKNGKSKGTASLPSHPSEAQGE